jgi:transposase
MSPDLTDTQLRQFLTEGLSRREIAHHTGVPRSTVQVRIKLLTLQGGPSPVDRPPQTVTRPPDERLLSPVDRGPIHRVGTARIQALGAVDHLCPAHDEGRDSASGEG